MHKFPKEYSDDILVRQAHHSSAIEGNTLTLPETVSIILHDTITGERDHDLREIYEVKNHQQAFAFVVEEVAKGEPLTVFTVKHIHAFLTDRLQYDNGLFKASDNAITGADFSTASAAETPQLMQQWVDNMQFRLDAATFENEKIEIISEAHIEFECIHPFSDGNGRVGRLLMIYSLLQHDLVPLVINNKERAGYISFLAEQDTPGFTRFVQTTLAEERERLQRFRNAEDQRVDSDE